MARHRSRSSPRLSAGCAARPGRHPCRRPRRRRRSNRREPRSRLLPRRRRRRPNPHPSRPGRPSPCPMGDSAQVLDVGTDGTVYVTTFDANDSLVESIKYSRSPLRPHGSPLLGCLSPAFPEGDIALDALAAPDGGLYLALGPDPAANTTTSDSADGPPSCASRPTAQRSRDGRSPWTRPRWALTARAGRPGPVLLPVRRAQVLADGRVPRARLNLSLRLASDVRHERAPQSGACCRRQRSTSPGTR